VGAFTVIDGARVTGADVGVNFFLTPEHVGRGRAEAACALLQELNDTDVVGHWIDQAGAPRSTALALSICSRPLCPPAHIVRTLTMSLSLSLCRTLQRWWRGRPRPWLSTR
jgi:hypothetical protein